MERPTGFSVVWPRLRSVCRLAPPNVLILLLLLPGAALAAPIGLRAQAPLVTPAPGTSGVDLANGDLREAVAQLGAGKGPPSGVKVKNGRVDVELLSSLSQGTIGGYVRDAGGYVVGNVPGQLTEAYVPYGKLVSLAHRNGVDYVRPPVRVDIPLQDGLAASPSAPSVTTSGPVVGEEVAKTNASSWQTAGLTGTGVKIGIIDAFNQTPWDNAANAGEVPVAPAGTFCQVSGVACNIWTYGGADNEHGTAVAEIIHEQAPNAQLYLAFANTTSDLQAAVNYFASKGVKIISRSQGSDYDGPGDGTGPIDTVVNSAVSQGMTWFQAPGNSGGPTYNGGMYGSYWRGTWADNNSNGYLNFTSTDDTLGLVCTGGGFGLRWSDWGTAADRTNYDVFIYDTIVGGTLTGLLASGTANQQTGAPPIEALHYACTADPPDYLVVQRTATGAGTTGDVLEYQQNGGGLEHWQNPFSAAIPAADSASAGEVSVGAIDPPNGTTIGSYSSWGPTNDNRIKPDLSAASGVQNYTSGTFSGTSASTPAAAGAAALVLQS
jgi:hypothetical protein